MTSNGSDTTEFTEDYQALIDYGIDPKVAAELDSIYRDNILSHADLDERALDALKEFQPEGGVEVLKEFRESNLEHVSNKSAYLCGVMKTYRQKNKLPGGPADAAAKKAGPDEDKIKEILDRTNYSLDVTTGQRKYGGPPPGEDMSSQPGAGHEVFCGKIPKEVFEDELIPLFEKCGKIWDLRLMMDPFTGQNRGYCFVTFSDKDGALEAVKQVDNFEIRPNKRLKCNVSIANLRLFVGNIPKSKSREEIQEEFSKITENLTEVIIYSSPDDPKKKNRGFAFLEYSTHKDASVAKRRIGNGRTRVWNCDIIVDWADPQEEPDEETMSKVKVLYVKNLKADVTEEMLKEKFEPFGRIERVKKIKDYGFVHYEMREDALKAMEELNGQCINDSEIDVSLAKPPSDNRQKQKQKRQQNMMMFDDGWGFGGPMMGGMAPRRGRGGGRGGRGGFDMYDDFYTGYGPSYGGGDFYGNDFYEFDYDYGMGGGYRNQRGGRMGYPPGRGGRGGQRGVRAGAAAAGRGAVRGARGVSSGGRGASRGGSRGGMTRGGPRGGGVGGAGGGLGPAGKRKLGMDHNAGQSKKRNTQDNWGAQPIAQQPLGNDQEWYQDSYGTTWG